MNGDAGTHTASDSSQQWVGLSMLVRLQEKWKTVVVPDTAGVSRDRKLVLPVNCVGEHHGLTLDCMLIKSLNTVLVSLPSIHWVSSLALQWVNCRRYMPPYMR